MVTRAPEAFIELKTPVPAGAENDRFHIIGAVPKDKSYQWVPLTVMGNAEVVQNQLERMRIAEWRPVPARRHPHMRRNEDGEIEIGGLVLMERPTELTDEARGKEIAGARLMYDDHPANAANRSDINGPGRGFPLIEPVTGNETSAEHGSRRAAAEQEFKATGGAFDISIKIVLTEREMDAAIACRLPLAEYAKRKVVMLRQRVEGDMHHRFTTLVLMEVGDGIFDIGTMHVHRGG